MGPAAAAAADWLAAGLGPAARLRRPAAPEPYGQQPGYGQPAQPQYAAQPFGQPQHGQPGGAQPWGSAPQKSGNGKLWAIIGGAVALLAAIGVTLWLVLSGGGRSIEDTVEGFMEAAKDNDATAAKEYLCPELASMLDMAGDSGLNEFNLQYEIKDTSEDGDKGTADVTVTESGDTTDVTVNLEKNDDGDWKICDFGTTATTSEGSSGSGG